MQSLQGLLVVVQIGCVNLHSVGKMITQLGSSLEVKGLNCAVDSELDLNFQNLRYLKRIHSEFNSDSFENYFWITLLCL